MDSLVPPEVSTKILVDRKKILAILSENLHRDENKTKTREQFLSESMELLQWCIMSRKLRSSRTLSEMKDVLSGYRFLNLEVQSIIEETINCIETFT